jgi:hypothetical protein
MKLLHPYIPIALSVLVSFPATSAPAPRLLIHPPPDRTQATSTAHRLYRPLFGPLTHAIAMDQEEIDARYDAMMDAAYDLYVACLVGAGVAGLCYTPAGPAAGAVCYASYRQSWVSAVNQYPTAGYGRWSQLEPSPCPWDVNEHSGGE